MRQETGKGHGCVAGRASAASHWKSTSTRTETVWGQHFSQDAKLFQKQEGGVWRQTAFASALPDLFFRADSQLFSSQIRALLSVY